MKSILAAVILTFAPVIASAQVTAQDVALARTTKGGTPHIHNAAGLADADPAKPAVAPSAPASTPPAPASVVAIAAVPVSAAPAPKPAATASAAPAPAPASTFFDEQARRDANMALSQIGMLSGQVAAQGTDIAILKAGQPGVVVAGQERICPYASNAACFADQCQSSMNSLATANPGVVPYIEEQAKRTCNRICP